MGENYYWFILHFCVHLQRNLQTETHPEHAKEKHF